MKANTYFLTALAMSAALASAHPGHGTNALHLHLGSPAATNALDLRLTFAALVLGLACQAMRAFKRR
jgi:hypothetical protein